MVWIAFQQSKIFRWLALAGVAVIAFFSMRASQRAEGRAQVNAQNTERLLEISQERTQIEMAVHGNDDPVSELRSRWTKQ
jgi:hypothetical protein